MSRVRAWHFVGENRECPFAGEQLAVGATYESEGDLEIRRNGRPINPADYVAL